MAVHRALRELPRLGEARLAQPPAGGRHRRLRDDGIRPEDPCGTANRTVQQLEAGRAGAGSACRCPNEGPAAGGESACPRWTAGGPANETAPPPDWASRQVRGAEALRALRCARQDVEAAR